MSNTALDGSVSNLENGSGFKMLEVSQKMHRVQREYKYGVDKNQPYSIFVLNWIINITV